MSIEVHGTQQVRKGLADLAAALSTDLPDSVAAAVADRLEHVAPIKTRNYVNHIRRRGNAIVIGVIYAPAVERRHHPIRIATRPVDITTLAGSKLETIVKRTT